MSEGISILKEAIVRKKKKNIWLSRLKRPASSVSELWCYEIIVF